MVSSRSRPSNRGSGIRTIKARSGKYGSKFYNVRVFSNPYFQSNIIPEITIHRIVKPFQTADLKGSRFWMTYVLIAANKRYGRLLHQYEVDRWKRHAEMGLYRDY